MTMNRSLRLLSVGLLAAGLSTLFAQAEPQAQPGQKGADRQQNESTMTGCLTKGADGYTLADEQTGTKIAVTGPADLEKHSANHKVTLIGTKSDTGGKSTFTVTKIQHIAAECKAPSQ